MKLVEQHIVKRNLSQFKTIDEACFKSKNLYNAALWNPDWIMPFIQWKESWKDKIANE